MRLVRPDACKEAEAAVRDKLTAEVEKLRGALEAIGSRGVSWERDLAKDALKPGGEGDGCCSRDDFVFLGKTSVKPFYKEY